MRFFAFLLTALAAILGLTPRYGVTVDSGVQGTESGLQDRRELHWRNVIKEIDPREAPFLSLFLKLDREKVSDVEFNLFEDEDLPGWTRVNNSGGYASGDTSIIVDDGTIIGSDYRIYVPRTTEVIKVASVSGNTLTCTAGRGYNSSTAAALRDDEQILVLGEIVLEGDDDYPALKTTRPVKVMNYCEIFQEAAGVTNTMKATKLRGPNELDRVVMRAGRTFKRKIERALRVGRKYEGGSAPNTERHTGGFEQFVTTNVFNLDGAISEPDLMYIAEAVFRYGSENKLVLCGRNARLQIDCLGLENTVISASDKSNPLGMEVTKVRTSAGTLNLVTDHFLDRGLGDRIHIIDLDEASLAILRQIEMEEDIENKKADKTVHRYIGELGLYIGNEKAHAVITGVTDIS